MSDSTATQIYRDIFVLLAKKPTPENKALAKKIDKMSREYDFSQCDMDCDNALKKLDVKIETYGDEEDE